MNYVLYAFEFNDGRKEPICHKKIDIKMVFDIKMITLTKKARLVVEGRGGGEVPYRPSKRVSIL